MPLPPVPVLLYHRVDHSGDTYSSTPEVFRRHLAWLARHGYRSLTTADLDLAMADLSHRLPERSVLLTFDDGYSCLESQVAPALDEFGFTGVAFVITARSGEIDGFTLTGEQLRWESARALAADGVLEFHSHTHSHGRWPLTVDQAEVVAADLVRSREVLASELGRPPEGFSHVAWPFGRTCPAWEVAADRAGFRTQYAVQRGAIDQWERTRRLPRLLTDGMQPNVFAAWMRTLTRPAGARAGNLVFGSLRRVRHGSAYL